MWLHELDDGLQLEVGGRVFATVDVSRHVLEVGSARRTRAFVASRQGVHHVAGLLLHAGLLRMRGARAAPSRARDLFGVSAPVELSGTKALCEALTRALKRSAERRRGALDDVEAAVARERRTPMVFSSVMLAAPYFLDDVRRFRAAAVCAAMLEEHPAMLLTVQSSEAFAPELARWRSLFSPTGATTRALTKSLADLPDGASAHDVWALRHVTLVRPLVSARHLRVMSEIVKARSAQRGAPRGEVAPGLMRLVQRVDARALEEILEAVAAVFGFAEASAREQEHLLGELLSEAPDVDAPSLPALVRRELARLHRLPALSLRLRDETAPPPAPMREIEGVTFLRTVGQVIAEGQRMRHCIGTRAAAAVRGEAFLFHVERDGERASVQLDASGRVVEATGTQNFGNEAARWGAEVLGAWGATWGGE